MTAPSAADAGGGRVRSVAVVGAGLIGTSVALALRARDVDVVLHDRDPRVSRRAGELGAGRAASWPPAEGDVAPADVCVVATPPLRTAEVLRQAQDLGLARTYTDVASVKARLVAEAALLEVDLSTFVGGHPMAGRERSGPSAARADLFTGRPWILAPGQAGDDHVDSVREVARLCGAVPVEMSPQQHDAAVALVSHVPHLAAVLVAARLAAASDDAVALSGSGVQDVTRVAASDPLLWAAILEANAAPVAAVLADLRADLDRLLGALDAVGREGPSVDAAREDLLELLRTGVRGRSRIPGKHGAPPTAYVVVPVVVADRPTELARLLHDAALAGANVEDVSIDHSPGRPVGVVELSVRPEAAEPLAAFLREQGWTVHL